MMNWETGIDMYTLMCIKWMTNKNLQYKKINKIKFKNSKKKKKNYPKLGTRQELLQVSFQCHSGHCLRSLPLLGIS